MTFGFLTNLYADVTSLISKFCPASCSKNAINASNKKLILAEDLGAGLSSAVHSPIGPRIYSIEAKEVIETWNVRKSHKSLPFTIVVGRGSFFSAFRWYKGGERRCLVENTLGRKKRVWSWKRHQGRPAWRSFVEARKCRGRINLYYEKLLKQPW